MRFSFLNQSIMLRNKLPFGTIFGLIFSAPIALILLLFLDSLNYFDFDEDDLILLVVFLVILIFAITVAVGLFRNKLWALRIFTFLLIIAAIIFTGVLIDSIGSYFGSPLFWIGSVLAIAFFTFGAVAMLNNDVVLQQFGVEETDESLDDILDA